MATTAKNLLVGSGRIVILDAECGWFGDPAFDPAFLLTHLHLKALLKEASREPLLALGSDFWSAYTAALGPPAGAELERRTVRLLLCLMLARAHGKSPAEYLGEGQRECVTAFVLRNLPRPPARLAGLAGAWQAHLDAR